MKISESRTKPHPERTPSDETPLDNLNPTLTKPPQLFSVRDKNHSSVFPGIILLMISITVHIILYMGHFHNIGPSLVQELSSH